jgi:hypothetical protein
VVAAGTIIGKEKKKRRREKKKNYMMEIYIFIHGNVVLDLQSCPGEFGANLKPLGSMVNPY